MSRRHAKITSMFLALLLAVFMAESAFAAPSLCPRADPNDQIPDDEALQACLDAGGVVELEPGLPGYILRKGLRLRKSQTQLRSSRPPQRARLLAHPELFAPMLAVGDDVSDYSLSHLIFDGNVGNRLRRRECKGYRDFGTNLQPRGSAFALRHVDSIHAMCGSACEVAGSDYEIENCRFENNGFSKDQAPETPEPWADGLTLLRCDQGRVRGNFFKDNTDINIVVGGGRDCRIEGNRIEQSAVYGFAGLHVFNFTGGNSGNGDHSGSVYRDNTIVSARDRLAFGIVVGPHPWFMNLNVRDAGTIENNEVSGAVVGLAVDGIAAGVVRGNRISGSQGTRAFMRCRKSAEYTAADFGAASLQPGHIRRYYHFWGCWDAPWEKFADLLKKESSGLLGLLKKGLEFK